MEIFEKIKSDVLKVYEDSLVDFFSDSKELTTTIHFPEFTITNSKGRTRKIINLYVRFNFYFDEDVCRFEEFTGARTTVFPDEYLSNYEHSHLDSGNFSSGHFGTFCLGSGTAMSNLVATLQMEYNSDIFTAFLFNIKNYVRWESLEGVPYIKMRSIQIAENRIERENVSVENAKHYCQGYLSNYTAKLKLIKNASLPNRLEVDISHLEDYLKKNNFSNMCYKKNGNFYHIGESRDLNINRPAFTFKGEQLYFTVKKQEGEEEIGELYVNPYYLNKIKEVYEQEINQHCIARC